MYSTDYRLEPLTRKQADDIFTWLSRFNLAEMQSAIASMPNPMIGRTNKREVERTINANAETIRSFLAEILFGNYDLVVCRKVPIEDDK